MMHVVAQKTTTSFDNSIKELSSSRDNYKIIHSKRLNVFKICFSIQFVLNFVLKQVCHENFDLHLLSWFKPIWAHKQAKIIYGILFRFRRDSKIFKKHCGVHPPAKMVSAEWCILRCFLRSCVLDSWSIWNNWLCGGMHTAKTISAVWITPQRHTAHCKAKIKIFECLWFLSKSWTVSGFFQKDNHEKSFWGEHIYHDRNDLKFRPVCQWPRWVRIMNKRGRKSYDTLSFKWFTKCQEEILQQF